MNTDQIYKEGYDEGYNEGYTEGYNEAKAEFTNISEGLPTKKIKLESVLDINEYTKEICDRSNIQKLLLTANNLVDIFYNDTWRIGCQIVSRFDKICVSYSDPSGHHCFRTLNLNKIKIIRNNEDEIQRALKNFEQFHNMEDGTANIKQVLASSAGVSVWSNSFLPNVTDDLVDKMNSLKFNIGKSSGVNSSGIKKRRNNA